MSDLQTIAKILLRLDEARAKHPSGASFDALWEEVGEAMSEAPGSARQQDELLDVMAVAMRLHRGEVHK